jgi:hypothetical protein
MKAGVSTFFSSAGMMVYDFANHLTLGSLDSERYNAQVESQGERLYNVAKNLGYSDESIAKGYGLAQALAGEVVGTNALAEAGTGYDLGNNTMLDGWERAAKAAIGTSQAAGTVASGLKVTGLNPSLTKGQLPKNLNFSAKVKERMDNPARYVPQEIIKDVIRGGVSAADLQGSRAVMYFARLWKNGRQYNIEVLYDHHTNTVWHVKYTQKAIGPLTTIL